MSRPWELWHQIRDFLTVRYFVLRDGATSKLKMENSTGHNDRLHSGLTSEQLDDPNNMIEAYHAAFGVLAREIAMADVQV